MLDWKNPDSGFLIGFEIWTRTKPMLKNITVAIAVVHQNYQCGNCDLWHLSELRHMCHHNSWSKVTKTCMTRPITKHIKNVFTQPFSEEEVNSILSLHIC